MEISRIDRDLGRFRDIVRGKIKGNLRKYISHGSMTGKKGKDLVSIPVPTIDIPHFRFGQQEQGGVGMGEGGEGQPVDAGQDGTGEAGEGEGDHVLEVEVTLEELARMLGEELELPRIEPRGKNQIQNYRDKYTGISEVGPPGLRHFKRTYRQALKRMVATGTYDPRDPNIVPIKRDMRYKSWNRVQEPSSNAAILYMMDVSGSMGDEQKEIVRTEAFWIDTWLRTQYKNVDFRFIIHDATAREVDRETFFHTRESGGTKISSAYTLAAEIIHEDYPHQEWNIYPFHFSDGDNWGGGDTEICIELLSEFLLPRVNQFSYGQVTSTYGSGQFKRDLESRLGEDEVLVTSQVDSKDDIPESIKTFLGKGR
ncbi:MAG TPA: DUF444 family protein [Candidatus Krumholzibacteria bacterium]|nr:DUF444 family protein [Candidatus Krumholzibacteria bacterium]